MAVGEKMNIFSLEGIDGSGKSTQQELVRNELLSSGITIATPTCPSHGVLGEFIRDNVRDLDPRLRTKLFMLDIEHENLALSEQEEIDAVLWDRYIDSFYTSNQEMTAEEATQVTSHLDSPVRTFFLDVPIPVIMNDRKEAHDHHTIPEWLEMKRARYLDLAGVHTDRIEVIDGTIDKITIAKHISAVILDTL